MRVLFALCAVAGGTMCGCSISGSARRRVRMLESVATGISLLRVHMIGMFQPVARALESTECALFGAVGEKMAVGISASEAWSAMRDKEKRRGGRIDALTAEDIEVLDRLFNDLGESGRDQQGILLSETHDAILRNLEAARRSAGNADRLYVPLGALTGLMIALVVV